LPAAQVDLNEISQTDKEGAERCLSCIKDWERQIQWGRVPQDQLAYLTGSHPYNFYREWVGQSDYRVVYEISNGLMTAVAVFPKDDNAYDIAEFGRRVDRS
jgi:mRNA interferase RelE/StbE